MEFFKLKNGFKKVIVVGDPHLHDNHKGRHKNYLKVCFWYMSKIMELVEEEKPDCLIITGDMIGVREKIIKYRVVLLEICKWFQRLNMLLNGNVYVLRGNHDVGQNLEFDFLHGMGYYKTASEVKFLDMTNSDGAIEVRFHLVDYGKEKEPLELCQDEDASNVTIFHNNMKVQGKTTWYPECAGFELSSMYNWKGVDMAIGGHIHQPSPWNVDTQIDGHPISLFYVGNATRPTYDKGIHNFCWNVVFNYEENEGVIMDTKKLELLPESEVFYSDVFIEDLTDDEIAESVRREDLHAIIKDLIQYRIADGDPITMIRSLPNTNPKAVEVAERYINLALNERKIIKR